MQKITSHSLSFRLFRILFCGVIIFSGQVIAQQRRASSSTCINGGDSVTFKGPCSGNTNYTNFSEQCILTESESIVEGNNGTQCTVTAEECGCHYKDMGQGVTTSIGSDSIDGCGNGCVTISPNFPHRACLAQGTSLTLQGSCDSVGYTFTPQCQLDEAQVGNGGDTECTVTEGVCGCLFWQEDSDIISGLINARHCDVCALVLNGNSTTSGALSSYHYHGSAGSAAFLLALVADFFFDS